MGVMKRVSLVFKAKANKALDRMEDPRETLDYSYQRQLEMQLDRQLGQIETLQAQARQALVLADKAKAEGDAEKSAQFEDGALSVQFVKARDGRAD